MPCDVSLGASFGCNYMTFLFSQPVVLKIIPEVNLELEVEAEVQLIRGRYFIYVYKLLASEVQNPSSKDI